MKKIAKEKKSLKGKLKRLKKKLSNFFPNVPMEERDSKVSRRYYAERDKVEEKIREIEKAILNPKAFLKAKNKNRNQKEMEVCRKTYYSWLGDLPFRDNRTFRDYADYCRSDYFKRLKAEVLRRDGYKCRKCGQKALTAHHEKYRWQWTKSRIEDCIAICKSCHDKIHAKEIEAKKEKARIANEPISKPTPKLKNGIFFGKAIGKHIVYYRGKFKGSFTKESDAIKRLSALRHQITP